MRAGRYWQSTKLEVQYESFGLYGSQGWQPMVRYKPAYETSRWARNEGLLTRTFLLA